VVTGTQAPSCVSTTRIGTRDTLATSSWGAGCLGNVRFAHRARLLLAAIVSVLVFAIGAAPASAERPYETQLTGTPTGGGGSEVPFTQPWGVTVDGADNVWVSDIQAGFVDKFNPSNVFVAQGNGEQGGEKKWTGAFTRGVAYSDAAEKLFVSDSNQDDVWVTNSDGTLESDIKGEGATWGTGCCFIYVAADNSLGGTAGDVYVTSSGGGETLPAVTRIVSTGAAANFSGIAAYITGNQITGTPEGAFEKPWGATIDSSGNLYVVDQGKNVVDEFGSNGEFIQTFSELTGTADAVAVDPTNGNVLVATESHVVDELSPSGELLSELDGTKTPAGSLGEALGVAVNSLGDLYVSDGANHVVDVFGPAGPPPPKFPLTVEVTGSGVGSVTSSPAGINCGATCSHKYIEGKTVTLTAAPSSKSAFGGWSGGGCSGTGTCEVTLTVATTVKAEFVALPQKVLNVEVNNPSGGSVSSTPGGIECGATCSAEFNEGSTVTLAPAAASGFKFVGWSGCTSESGEDCEVELGAEETVKVTFEPLPKFALNVVEEGTGDGTITSVPSGINCGPGGAGTCSSEFTETETIVLSATPASGSDFVKWSGCTSELEGRCEVTITAEVDVTAEFSQRAPVVNTASAAAVTSTTAVLAGRINALGSATSACRFLYGTTTAYGSEATCEPGSIAGTTAQQVTASLSSLAPDATYHFKLIAVNAGGEAGGNDSSFQTGKSSKELAEEAAAQKHQEEEAVPRGNREAEETERIAQSKLENEAATKRMQEMEVVLKRALAEEATVKQAEEPISVKLLSVEVGTSGLRLTIRLGTAATVKVSGPGLRTTRKRLAAGSRQIRVFFTASGRHARARGRKVKVTIRLSAGGKVTSLSRSVKL
jgi:hypothetical protein